MVAQYYDTDVNKEYAIRGNSAILKCVVPSFVADFVKVLSWHTDQGEEFVPGDDYGRRSLALSIFFPTLASRSFPLSHRTRKGREKEYRFFDSVGKSVWLSCNREYHGPVSLLMFSSLQLVISTGGGGGERGGPNNWSASSASTSERRCSPSPLTPFASLSPLPPSPTE